MATRSGRRTSSRYASARGANRAGNTTNITPPMASAPASVPTPTPETTTIGTQQNIQRELGQQGALPEARDMSFDKGSVFDKFLKTSPTKFDGKADPAEAEKWIRRIKKIFAQLECTDEHKVSMATYVLEGPAEDWWDMVERQYQGRENELNWNTFLEIFNEKFIPIAVKRQKQLEFLSLEQGSMTVAEYECKFAELSKYSTQVDSESDKVLMFEKGLRPAIRSRVAVLQSKTLAELVTRAQLVEECLEDAKKGKPQFSKRPMEQNSRGQSNGGGNFQKRRNTQAPIEGNNNQQARSCTRCGKQHSYGYFCDGTPKRCYNCGKDGHVKSQCRAPNSMDQQAQRSFQGQRSTTQNSNQSHTQGQNQRQAAPARVYALTQKEAEASPSVVQGTLFISSIPARVLIDSGSTHSFASPKFLRSLPVALEQLDEGFVVSTPVGDTILLDTICRSCGVQIDDRVLLVDLICLDMHDFDVILEMDWLTSNYATVDCR